MRFTLGWKLTLDEGSPYLILEESHEIEEETPWNPNPGLNLTLISNGDSRENFLKGKGFDFERWSLNERFNILILLKIP